MQTYLFGQTLFFRGFCEADRIWGTWQDAADGHGGFQIWPVPADGLAAAGTPQPHANTTPASLHGR
jgi:hypothetical protein